MNWLTWFSLWGFSAHATRLELPIQLSGWMLPLMDISSSMVRDFIAQGPKTQLSPTSSPVLDYIEKEELYSMAYQDYINCSREALLERMAELLPKKRLTHCLGVERAAIELAKDWS